MSSFNKDSDKFSRKDFLKTGMLSSFALAPALISTDDKPMRLVEGGSVENVIFMVSDGMSSGTLMLADLISQWQYGRQSNWMKLYDSDRTYHRGLMDMASNNSPVTDSAAASSSWACGRRLNNGAINVGPNGERYKPILKIFQEAGKKTGLVTTTRITHATPAGFGTNVPYREMEDEIAAQYLEHKYDLLMGGGLRHFVASERDDERDLLTAYRREGYQVVRDRGDLNLLSTDRKLLGLFADSHLPYTIDRNHVKEIEQSVPTLNEMAGIALDRFSRSRDGFILQIEGGRVDHGGHDNDPAGLIYDQIAFDETLGTVLDFVEGRDDTLLIITTDHGTGNPGLNGMGDRYTASDDLLKNLYRFRRSSEWVLDDLDESSSESRIRERVKHATDIGLSPEEVNMITGALKGQYRTPYREQSEPTAVLGALLANYIGINWTSTAHTSDYVELVVIAPELNQVDGLTRNTELFDLMVNSAGVKAQAGVR